MEVFQLRKDCGDGSGNACAFQQLPEFLCGGVADACHQGHDGFACLAGGALHVFCQLPEVLRQGVHNKLDGFVKAVL